ncbi:MAG: mechanosensitive ion channel [Anaerolineales bacterium]|nr:mechanosensitive ion channel [Anaerolineales bacterium]
MNFLNNIIASLGATAAILVPILAIIIGLFVAWIVARIGAFIVRKGLERANVDQRASDSLGTKTQITNWVSGFTFWALFVFVLIQLVNLAQGMGFLPTRLSANAAQSQFVNEVIVGIIGVGVSLLVAWIIATVLKFLVIRVLNVTRLDERLGEKVTGKKSSNMNESIGKAVFWLVFLIFIPSILNSLGIGAAADSVQGLVNQMLNYIPGIIGAVIIVFLGALLARIIRQIVTGFLEGLGIDSLGERVGLSKAQSAQPLSGLLGTVVYILVLVPVIIQALDVLNLPVISEIGTQLLSGVIAAILSTLGAAVLLGVAYYIAKFISDVTTSLLAGIGVDRLPSALGFKATKGTALSGVIGYIVLVAVMLLAVQSTAEFIGLASIAALVGSLITFGGILLFGIVIFMAGIYIANIASNLIISTGGSDALFFANIARWAILIFVAGIALSQAGVTLADSAITIILATIGVAVALAFGLGGREIAAKQLEKWLSRRSGK